MVPNIEQVKAELLALFKTIAEGERIGDVIVYTIPQIEEVVDQLFVVAGTHGLTFEADRDENKVLQVSIIPMGETNGSDQV